MRAEVIPGIRHIDDLSQGPADGLCFIPIEGRKSPPIGYLLICGDVFDLRLCAAGDGEAEPGRLFDSVSRTVFSLPGQTLVFPAHPLKGRRVALLHELRMRCSVIDPHSASAADCCHPHRLR